jgi:putative transport protein
VSLFSNSVFLLVFIIISGYLLGKVTVMTFSFGSSAVIFIALIFGYFGYQLPADFQTLGLVLFIYAIGIQAGPGFLSSFRANGVALSLGAGVIVVSGFAAALVCS